MDGGLAVLGFGLFLFSIANLYARSAYGLAWSLLALALVSMGLAFSESKSLRTVSLGLGGALMLLALIGLVAGVAWWLALGTFLFGAAYLTLWAEFRFTAFGHVREGDIPHRMHAHGPGRWRLPLPFRRHRV